MLHNSKTTLWDVFGSRQLVMCVVNHAKTLLCVKLIIEWREPQKVK